jgi:hypothetical protein
VIAAVVRPFLRGVEKGAQAFTRALGAAAEFGLVEILGLAQRRVLDVVLKVEEELVEDFHIRPR